VIFKKRRFFHIFLQKSTIKFAKSLKSTFNFKQTFSQLNVPLSEDVLKAISIEAFKEVKKQKRSILPRKAKANPTFESRFGFLVKF
jgi:hypothetical protein